MTVVIVSDIKSLISSMHSIIPRNFHYRLEHRNYLPYFAAKLIFSRKIEFDMPCKLSPQETICMECQIRCAGKTKKKTLQNVAYRFFYPAC